MPRNIPLTEADEVLACLSTKGRETVEGWPDDRRERFLELCHNHQAIGRSARCAALRSWGASAREDHEG